MSRARSALGCRAAVVLILSAACLVPANAAGEVAREGERIQGITISTHTDGRDWAQDQMTPTMVEIKQLGANWITIHPYAAIRGDGSVRFAPIDPDNPPAHITRPIGEAHARGLKILIKPHLAYWGSPFKWRGEIVFNDEAEWRRFWRDYERWIVALAEVTREADGFAVGTELDLTLGHEDRWRRLIERVREKSPAPLTYAANWNGYEAVPFWDALDAVGIQAYFPLTDAENLTEEAIRRGWDGWMKRLREFSEKTGRSIVFTELGYNHSALAPVRPWDPGASTEEARGLQETCMRIALLAIRNEPSVIGAFLWKWFPQPHQVGRNYQLATPEMKQVIRSAWTD